jgi:CHASE2 domain-containing sensor protein
MEQYAVPFMVNYYRPVLIGLAGLAILWVWEGKRAGYLIAVVLAAIATVFGASVTVFNTMTQEWIGLLTAVVAVGFPAIMMLWYSFQGYRTHRSEA